MTHVHATASGSEDRHVLSIDSGLVEKASSALGVLRRQKWVIGSCAILGLLLGASLLLSMPPIYVARAELMYDRGARPVLTQQPVLTETPIDTSFFESQIEIIRSDSIALAVVRKLKLAEDPRFASGGMFGSLLSFVRSMASPAPEELEAAAASQLNAKLEAQRVGRSSIIEVSFKSDDPEIAEKVLRSVIDEYVESQRTARVEAARTASRWLEQRLDELRRRATADEQAVNAYKAKNQIVSATGVLIGEQALTALNNELVGARAKANEARARFDRIETVLRASDSNLSVDATVSDAVTSPVITQLRQEYLTLTARESEYATHYGKEHLSTVRLRERIKSVQQSIRSELRRLAENSRSEYLIAKNREEYLEKELSSKVSQSQVTNRAQVALHDLESAAQNSRSLYNLLQARFLETAQQQQMSMSDVQQIGTIGVSEQQRAPKFLGLALAGGIAVGVGISLLREMTNRVLRTSKQIENQLGLPCIALVPVLANESGAPDSVPMVAQRELAPSPMLEEIARTRFSPFTEAIRCVRLAGDMALKSTLKVPLDESRRSGVIIGMTSSVPDEGKSTIAISLAQMAANTRRRAIVIDSDLRNPSLSRSLSPNATTGLLDVLAGRIPLEEAIWIEPSTQLAFLPAIDSHERDPAEVFSSPGTAAFFESLRRQYDYVIVDFSPIAPAVELSATAAFVDGYIFVVEWGRTRIDLIQRALSGAPEVYEKIIGVALNKADMEEVRRYDSYDYNRHTCNYD